MAEGAKTRTVADVMTRDVLTTSASELLAKASGRMIERKVGSVIVVDDERPVGILTERDLVRATAAGADLPTALVSEWMTGAADTVSPTENVKNAYDSLAKHGYRHFPVVEDGRLVGVVSMRDMLELAQVLRIEHPGAIEARRGLEGVVVAETEVGDVRGQEGFYHYRQYNAVELAEKRTLEDVWHLLYEGHLPSPAEREAFAEEIRSLRDIPPAVKKLLPAIATAGEHFVPLDALRCAYSTLAYALDFRSWLDVDKAELRRNAMQTSAVMPTLIMALYRLNQGMEPIDPNPELPYAANYLYMLTGETPEAGLGPGHRAVPDLDHRPRLQLLHLHRPGHHLHRRRPRLRRRRRHRRPLRSPARRGAQPGPRHARRHRDARQGRGLDPGRRSRRATGSWASATASTRPTTPGR